MNINVYDFDKTIYDGDSSIDFYLYCMKLNKKIIFRIPSFLFSFFCYKLKGTSKEKMKENYFSFLNDIDDIDGKVKDFWTKNKKKIKGFYLNKDHSNDIIISASPYFLLKDICDDLRVKDLIATDVDKNNGKFLGKNCYGEEKVIRLKNEYNDFKISKFYTDSLSDLPLMELSNITYIVKKNKIVKYDKKGCDKND